MQRWPKEPTKFRTSSSFRSTYSQTLDLLAYELQRLDAKEIVIEAWFAPSDIRNDGCPRSDRRPTQPGVILKFTGTPGAVSMPCDTFTRWEDNLRAIALSLQALRAVDRYGCAGQGQQYTGWKQIGAGTRMPTFSSLDSAAEFITKLSGDEGRERSLLKPVTGEVIFKELYRRAVTKCHPDTHPNDPEAEQHWSRLQDAAAMFKLHYGSHQQNHF
jgi:hypothetical protein